MTDKKHNEKSERTLLTALLLSSPGPLVTGIAAVISGSATQLADFIRRTSELVASFSSWWIFRKIHRNIIPYEERESARARLERTANLVVAAALICSGIALLTVGIIRLFVCAPTANVILGLIIAAAGLFTNVIFMLRYGSLNRRQNDAVIAAQQRLYWAKSCVDLCVVLALLMIAVAPVHPATRYVDALGSIIVSGYLLWNGVKLLTAIHGKNLRRSKG